MVAMATKFELKLAITRLICKISPRFVRLTAGFGFELLNVSQILLRPTLVAMATKFGSKLAITQLVWEILPRFLRLTGGFRGLAIERCQWNSTATDPGCYGNEMWAKIGSNAAYVQNISEILSSNSLTGGFRGRPIQRCHLKLPPTDPGCHGNEFWAKIGYNSACMRDISKIRASSKGFQSRAIERC